MTARPKTFLPVAGILLAACLSISTTPTLAQSSPLPNAQFDQGDKTPDHWILSGGQGRWVDRQIIEVTGSGNDSNHWRCTDYKFVPGALYHFQVRARRTAGSGGCVITGPSFANRDYHGLSKDWRWYGHVFRAPESAADGYLRVGQWHTKATVQFDAVRISATMPVHKSTGNLLLGQGESIRDGRYVFQSTFSSQGSNYQRPLQSATAGFNSTRWCFGSGSQVTYRFSVPGCPFRSGTASVNIGYHTGGQCIAEVSRDQSDWQAVLTLGKLGTAEAKLPAEIFPAEVLFLRLRGTSGGSFQVHQVGFQAELAGKPPEATGKTVFADLQNTSPELLLEQLSLCDSGSSGRMVLRAVARNKSPKSRVVTLFPAVSGNGREARQLEPQKADVPAGQTAAFAVDLPADEPGEHQILLSLQPAGGKPVKTSLSFSVADYYRADYGKLLAAASGKAALWWCDATHKIPPRRSLPTASSPAAELAAARHDFEAVQIVVRPEKTLKGLTATAGTLAGPNGATIPADRIQILRVYYHLVDHPTDRTGVRDRWPDALPPLAQPVDVPAGENQPLWVLVYVPKDAEAGDYSGNVSLKAEGWSATVPLRLHVWNFTLPEKNHSATAFGLSVGNVYRYHQLKTEADKRKVLDMYFQIFSDHRISPYDLTPMDPIRVKFLPEADPPRAEVDFSAFDRAMARAVEKFHFTNLRLPIRGMGGGTFHARHDPKIGKYGEDTPQYQAMFSSYVRQIEDHLREKGWLNMVYIYWFDEPAPRDYEFVRSGMERLKRYAPGLKRMLTEQVEEELAGAVDIWCPVSPNYDHEAAEKRRAHGEQFWWYVCCGPKAPYCTLFIDHPATELRIWLWQTWQRNIVGNLVWQATYWTSSAAYPDKPQNPYEDPMGYVSGYSTPKGTKRYWGNGDGRFVYPPLAAAVPGASGPGPVIEPPVSSIRWEMLREGIEDHEYLYMLRELLAKRRGSLQPQQIAKYEELLRVPDSITKDMTTFATDPTPIYTHRKKIAEAIEGLTE